MEMATTSIQRMRVGTSEFMESIINSNRKYQNGLTASHDSRGMAMENRRIGGDSRAKYVSCGDGTYEALRCFTNTPPLPNPKTHDLMYAMRRYSYSIV
jgi:hypothetical protein